MPASRPPHILAIDDEPGLQALYADLLEGEGYAVTLAGRPPPIADVLDLRPDLILLDLVFDGAPLGWAYLDALERDDGARDIPIVLCSAAADEVRERADDLRQDGVAVVLKPFDLDDLLDAVSRCLAAGGDGTAPPRPARGAG